MLQAMQYVDEVLVVDDGSTDNVAKVAELAGATVISHGENRGKGAAIQTILEEAKKRNPDVLVLLDADAQHNPDEIPALMEPILFGEADLVIGSRAAESDQTKLYRRIGQRVLLHFTRFLSKKKRITDSESGFRALSSKAMSRIELKEMGFAVETEMIVDASGKGLGIVEVPVSNIYTTNGSTLNPALHGMGVLSRIIVMISRRRPLFFFGIAGSILLVGGIFIGIEVVQQINEGEDLPTGTALISVLLFIVGMFCIFTGIILNALKDISTGK